VQIREMFKYGLAGTKTSKQPHIRRAEYAFRVVSKRFGIRQQEQLRCKHLEWFLRRHMSERKPSTQYSYWRSIWYLCHLLGKGEDWLPRLRGPWESLDGCKNPHRHPGGRPPNLPSAAKLERAKKKGAPRRTSEARPSPRRRKSRDDG
jgi:hypothetical protein